MKVTVFGIGYVGLVHAAVLAEVGHNVMCIDVDECKIKNLKKGIIPFFEPGLAALVHKNYNAGCLHFTTDFKVGIIHSTIQFITVGTPADENGSTDLKHVLTVAHIISQHMMDHKIVVNKSTVPVGTANKLRQIMIATLKKRGHYVPFDIVSNPEFMREGTAVTDCMRPDRIVIGSDDKRALKLICELYKPFNRNHDRMIMMDVRSAELTKYAANCMLATKISFMNEMANLAELLGADIEKVRKGMGSDPRIGYNFIYPGCGYGGSCFPKDVQSLIRISENIGYPPKLLQAVEQVNIQQKYKLVQLITEYFDEHLDGKIFALWGLAFKPNTNDMREASSRVLIEKLWQLGAIIQAYDPEAKHEVQRIYGQRDDLRVMNTKEDTLQDADALVICTEWQSFRSPNFDVIKRTLKHPIIFDGRNLFDPKRLKDQGFTYYAIGRGSSVHPVI
ncbi:UDP-glucose dehydrogenase family protein [Candidatus Gillettellia adelgis]